MRSYKFVLLLSILILVEVKSYPSNELNCYLVENILDKHSSKRSEYTLNFDESFQRLLLEYNSDSNNNSIKLTFKKSNELDKKQTYIWAVRENSEQDEVAIVLNTESYKFWLINSYYYNEIEKSPIGSPIRTIMIPGKQSLMLDTYECSDY